MFVLYCVWLVFYDLIVINSDNYLVINFRILICWFVYGECCMFFSFMCFNILLYLYNFIIDLFVLLFYFLKWRCVFG